MLHDTISCQDKFQTCAPSQTEESRRKINEIAKSCKETISQLHKAISLIGIFSDGHLYGLPKIHKDRINSPPLRPIITLSGTVIHEVTQYLYKIVRPYCNQKYILRSSARRPPCALIRVETPTRTVPCIIGCQIFIYERTYSEYHQHHPKRSI